MGVGKSGVASDVPPHLHCERSVATEKAAVQKLLVAAHTKVRAVDEAQNSCSQGFEMEEPESSFFKDQVL